MKPSISYSTLNLSLRLASLDLASETKGYKEVAQLADLEEEHMKQGQMPRRRRYPRLLKEYAQILEQKVRNGELKEDTPTQYLNDAQVVMECLVAASPADDIKAKVGLLYRGYYGNIIKELKAIMGRRA